MSEDREVKGVIFNVQHYSIHDGPGIRTTVFIKGCPLRCIWCQNPESQYLQPQLFFDREICIGCAKCVQVCPEGAIDISEGKSGTNRAICQGNGNCIEVCPNEARNLMGRYATVDEVFKDVNSDAIFYQRSGGGVTLSGGEPLAQPEFTVSLLKMCRNAGMHTTLDTCGYAEWEKLRQVLDYVDLVLYDFKYMDPAEHEKHTGVSNELVLDNAVRIYHDCSLPMLARMPIVPGYNDSVDNIEATARFIVDKLGASMKIHLLPYHSLGGTKYQRLEKTDNSVHIQPPTEEYMLELKQIFESFGLTSEIGG